MASPQVKVPLSIEQFVACVPSVEQFTFLDYFYFPLYFSFTLCLEQLTMVM